MDKNFLKEKKLYEAHKQFMRLCEWSYVPQNIEEDDDDQNDMQQPSDDSQMSNDDAMNNDNANMGNDSMGGNADSMPMDSQNQGMGDVNQGTDMGMGGGDDNQMPPMDDNSQIPPMDNTNMPPMGDSMDDMDSGEEDDVIDVDDITNAQEKMNTKVNHVGRDLGDVDDKITTLLNSLSKMEQMIDNNNQEIAKFKQEFEKRNPTQTEKLNLRSLDSYPFNVNPKDYWEEKGIDPNSNYSGYSDNDKPTTDEYEITNNDVDDFSERDIENSFDIDDDLNQDIKKIFGL